MATDVFLSVGRTATPLQEQFVSSIEKCLQSNELLPRTAGRSSFSSQAPLKHIEGLMDHCSGAVVVAFERMYIASGTERRGGPDAKPVEGGRLPTVWNQVEASMAYTRGLPLLVIVEHGLKSEGLLEARYDWYVQWVQLDPNALDTAEFRGVLQEWKQRVLAYKLPSRKSTTRDSDSLEPAALTVGQLLKALKPSQLWGVLVALTALLIAVAKLAFDLGQQMPTAGP